MKILIAFTLTSILLIQIIYAQSNKSTFVISNAKPIDTTRYQDIKGSPYLFKNFVKARITSNEMDIFEEVMVNYNGYTKEFEVKQEDWYTALDGKWYLEVEVLEDDKGEKFSMLFRRGLHEKFNNEFVQICYKGQHIMLIKYHYMDMLTKEVQDVGKTVEFKRFHPKSIFYLLEGGKLTILKNKKKALLKTLSHTKELENFIKKEKINLSNEGEFAKLIGFYEKIAF